jgi:hypothetical protein
MDEGGGSYLPPGVATYSFTLSEVDLLVSVLQRNFGLDCHRVIKRDRGHVCWRIYISVREIILLS